MSKIKIGDMVVVCEGDKSYTHKQVKSVGRKWITLMDGNKVNIEIMRTEYARQRVFASVKEMNEFHKLNTDTSKIINYINSIKLTRWQVDRISEILNIQL